MFYEGIKLLRIFVLIIIKYYNYFTVIYYNPKPQIGNKISDKFRFF